MTERFYSVYVCSNVLPGGLEEQWVLIVGHGPFGWSGHESICGDRSVVSSIRSSDGGDASGEGAFGSGSFFEKYSGLFVMVGSSRYPSMSELVRSDHGVSIGLCGQRNIPSQLLS